MTFRYGANLTRISVKLSVVAPIERCNIMRIFVAKCGWKKMFKVATIPA